MKILITGGAGFLGSHVAEYYATKNEEVINFDMHTAAQKEIKYEFADGNYNKGRRGEIDEVGGGK